MDDDRWKDDLAAAHGMVMGAIFGFCFWFLVWFFYLLS